MVYDDFSLPENYEKIATEYYKALENKGFVFVRLDKDENEKRKALKNTMTALDSEISLLVSMRRIPSAQISRMVSGLKGLAETQKASLTSLYKYVPIQNAYRQNLPSGFGAIITIESSVLKTLFELLNLEDDHDKHLLISNMISSRLDLLSNV